LAYGGQMSRARELAKREVEELKRAGQATLAISLQVQSALRGALTGNLIHANREAEEAIKFTDVKDFQAVCATIFGLAGNPAEATRLADDLERRFRKTPE
jgi:hypothetical protein